MSSIEERWAKWDDLRARQDAAVTIGEKLDLQREEEELRDEGIREVLMNDLRQDPGWWWLSFADETGFLGACIVQAAGIMEGTIIARALGCNPGGEVLGEPLSNLPPEEYIGRLLSMQEIDEMRETDVEWKAIE